MRLQDFYSCKQWLSFRRVVIAERLNDCGETICEYCGEPITRAYDIILHHVTELTEENVNDYNVSLNPTNIKIVHHKCHNIIHNKLGYKERNIYLVYGAPLSGKTAYVESVREYGDLIVDMDSIWQCVSGCDRYIKPPRLNAVVFGVRDNMLDAVRYRRGKWQNAYIIGGYPLISERERLCRELGAKEIFIECDRGECLKRLYSAGDGRDIEQWEMFINDWFSKYIPPLI